MLRYFFLGLMIICLFSCKEKTSAIQQTNYITKKKLTIDAPNYATQLTKLTPNFVKENNINQWIQFKKFKDSMEDIKELNPAGIMTFISELYKTTSSLLKSSFPEEFNKPAIYSRIKVVQTQIIKCHYYATNKQNEKLNQSLDKLYLEYNILLNRMISMADENKIPLDSIGVGKTNFQDSKRNPAFSRK
mgnify:FL=1|tara:strand:- start:4469 stop:5035 length:567 start_codon:yes stop_codon:yes gene_type:complete